MGLTPQAFGCWLDDEIAWVGLLTALVAGEKLRTCLGTSEGVALRVPLVVTL